MAEMTKEDLKQALIAADAKADEVQAVIDELYGNFTEENLEAALEKALGEGNELTQIAAFMQNKATSAVMLKAVSSMIVVAARSVAIAKFMGVDPEILKNLPNNK